MAQKLKNIIWPTAVGLLFLLLWQKNVINTAANLTSMQLPLPSEIWSEFAGGFGSILKQSGVTVEAALIGLLIGSVLGYVVAMIASMFPKWGYGSLMVVSAFNSIPIVALASIMNRWFPTALGSKVGVVTIVCMAAMAINAYRGLNDLKPFSGDLMTSYAANKRLVFLKLRIPNSIPNVFVALKINVVSAMMGALISEYFAKTTAGLGFFIKSYMKMGNMISSGWAYILMAALVSILMHVILTLVERRVLKWHASQR